jgi:hypothetical protein
MEDRAPRPGGSDLVHRAGGAAVRSVGVARCVGISLAPTKDVVEWSAGLTVGRDANGSPAPRRIIRPVNEELERWYAERDREREVELAYWDGYRAGLARAHEPEEPERDPDWLHFGEDGKLIEPQSS